jgi:SSS family solute:Na+ symporter
LGYAVIILFIILQQTEAVPALTNIHFLLQVPLFFAISCLLNIAVSNMSAAPSDEKLQGMIWTRKIYTEETAELAALPWYKNYRILSVILLVITAIIVIWFR